MRPERHSVGIRDCGLNGHGFEITPGGMEIYGFKNRVVSECLGCKWHV